MPKLTTEDCVATIISFKGGNISDWKRRSKKNIGSDIIRVFENVRTEEMVEVLERDGALYVGKVSQAPITPVVNQSVKGKVYYVIADMDGETLLYVTDSSEFDVFNRQSDVTPREAFRELRRLGYNSAEVTESVLEITPLSAKRTYDLAEIDEWATTIEQEQAVNIDELKAKLQTSSVFQFSQRFSDFLKGHEIDGTIVE